MNIFNMFGRPKQQGFRIPPLPESAGQAPNPISTVGPSLGLSMPRTPSPGAQPGAPGFQIPPGLAEQMNAPLMKYAFPDAWSPQALGMLASLRDIAFAPPPRADFSGAYRAPMPATERYIPRRKRKQSLIAPD